MSNRKPRGGAPVASSIDSPPAALAIFVVGAVRQWGKHHWPKAPLRWASLREPHSHEFRIEATIQVESADRALAIEDLQATIRVYFQRFIPQGVSALTPSSSLDLGTLSCEQIALQLFEFLTSHLPDASMQVIRTRVYESIDAGAEVIGA